VIQYLNLVRRIKKRQTPLALCRSPRTDVVVLLSKKRDIDDSESELKNYVKFKISGSVTKCI